MAARKNNAKSEQENPLANLTPEMLQGLLALAAQASPQNVAAATAAKASHTTKVTNFDLPDGGKVECFTVTHSAGSKDGSRAPIEYKTPRVSVNQRTSGEQGRVAKVNLTPAMIEFLRGEEFGEWAEEEGILS